VRYLISKKNMASKKLNNDQSMVIPEKSRNFTKDSFEDLEYIIIKRGSEILETLKHDKIMHMTKLDLQEYLGDAYGEAKYTCIFKRKGQFKGNPQVVQGLITDKDKIDSIKFHKIGDEINSLKNLILNKNNDSDQKKLIELSSENASLKEQVKYFDEKNKELRNELNEYKLEYDKLANQEPEQNSDGLLKTLTTIVSLMKSETPLSKVADNNEVNQLSNTMSQAVIDKIGVPKEFLSIFAKVNWEKVNPVTKQSLIEFIDNYSKNNLPQK
jgi:hypothetical protein